MFLDFYKMRAQPFGVTPDPRFLYLGKSHREALASLYYGIQSDRGFVALIAQPGLGKTTLAFQLLEKLQQASRTVFLFQTQCNSKELFHYLLNGLGVDAEGMELVSMHNKLNEILCREMLAGRRFVLAIDEAQNLDSDVLETIRLLSNFETSRDKMLQILLIGQPPGSQCGNEFPDLGMCLHIALLLRRQRGVRAEAVPNPVNAVHLVRHVGEQVVNAQRRRILQLAVLERQRLPLRKRDTQPETIQIEAHGHWNEGEILRRLDFEVEQKRCFVESHDSIPLWWRATRKPSLRYFRTLFAR